ncbi:MAG: hypothetical protein RJB43_944, partial [Verrucomicrobiota bacterium]
MSSVEDILAAENELTHLLGAQQAVVLGVGNGRRVEHVVLVIVAGECGPQFFGPQFMGA